MYKAVIGKTVIPVETGSGQAIVNGRSLNADILTLGNGKFHVLVNNKSYTAEIVDSIPEEKLVSVRINSRIYRVAVKDKYDELLHDLGLDLSNARHAADVKAPMPGLVLNVMVQPGQKIKKGDALIVLEAMKMENILKASADGEVRKVNVKKGDKVEKNQVMVNLL